MKSPVPVLATIVLLLAQPASGSDVLGYSILKGRFLNQLGPESVVPDPDFGFGFLASIDLSDFDLLTDASLTWPDGTEEPLEDVGMFWAYLDSQETLNALNAANPWGTYTVNFEAVNDGLFSCELSCPSSPFPPYARLINFEATQAVDPARPLALSWQYLTPPDSNDFVQVYINLGHAEVFSTPNAGEPGALNGFSTNVTVPGDTFIADEIFELNIEVTRYGTTNSLCYPDAAGGTGTFSSTSVDLLAVRPPELLLSGLANGLLSVRVVTDPGARIVLEGSGDLLNWTGMLTNTNAAATNDISLPTAGFDRLLLRVVRDP